jgi:hypothetical protein
MGTTRSGGKRNDHKCVKDGKRCNECSLFVCSPFKADPRYPSRPFLGIPSRPFLGICGSQESDHCGHALSVEHPKCKSFKEKIRR